VAVENQWQEIAGTPIEPDEAWRILDDWRAQGKEIGMLYCARSATATIAAMCRVRVARKGMLLLKSESGGASLNLKMARFTYGPMQVWPRWPSGPTSEVLALQVFLADGEWLVLAEGYLPKELAPLALPM
jgi:hypothetical protein